ncbi:MAG: DUF502 domain-containing protein [Syntrophales bacterium]
MKKKIKRIFLTGLAVVIPAGVTIYILFFIVGMMDNLLRIIPSSYHPESMLLHIPGLGVIVTVILIFICGLVTTSYLGNRLFSFGERIVGKIPVVRSIYQAIKRISESLFMDKAQSFKKVVIVEYPRRGVYSIGFITCTPNGEIQRSLHEKCPCVGVYIPCALTPTTGVFVMIPGDELIEVGMSVEEAFTLIISAGIVTPHGCLLPGNLKPAALEDHPSRPAADQAARSSNV